MKFGERLRKARQDKNLTQDTVAKHMIVSRQTISSWENEKTYPDITSLIKLSEYYDISLDLLLKEDNGMREYLSKKDLANDIKPVSWVLVTMDIIFLVFMLGITFNIIHFGHIIDISIFILGFLNVIALSIIDKIRRDIGIERNHRWAEKIRNSKFNKMFYDKFKPFILKHYLIENIIGLVTLALGFLIIMLTFDKLHYLVIFGVIFMIIGIEFLFMPNLIYFMKKFEKYFK
ncbi:XRE family transcriptional regulator [Apilactobacillus micheneri]|uniref:helix-turn-helix domain-containing protein n=1 Tax=Apilactobacillus micheneri TaxID=1899430 RepID=UPI00112D292C|nr:helix-turn-helix transcriptional regulator [Apilactobacillus micheneri]TPR43562.1 XRE family transcriptional regulator [Apilactobacillus micheneri]TPR47512.1 XRE family transcriptional regulator [Apilactobacillus micheneri]